MTAEDLRKLLEALPNVDSPLVEVVGERPHLLATVTSSSFANVDEADRQEQVWAHLRAKRPNDTPDVEFVFTNAPGEPG